MSKKLKTPLKYARGTLYDADGLPLFWFDILHTDCTRKLVDRFGKTLVGAINSEERGKALAKEQSLRHRGLIP